MKIGSQLKKARENMRFSQQEVAYSLEISQKTLSNIESDKSNPTVKQLCKLSEIYNLDILELLSNQGLVFRQSNLEENLENQIHSYTEKLIKQFEERLKEKDEIISLLRYQIIRLKKK